MKERILAVFSVLPDNGVAIAQMVLRVDGSLETFGDPSAATDALALLLRVGPQKLEELTQQPR